MTGQNIYDDPEFLAGYVKLDRQVRGLDGAADTYTSGYYNRKSNTRMRPSDLLRVPKLEGMGVDGRDRYINQVSN